jgi:predicted NUDIX family phosphoesterase
MSPQVQTAPLVSKKLDELVLVVKREYIVSTPGWHGIMPIDVEQTVDIITAHQEYMPRSLAEHDPRYKQIIPYLVFTHDNRYFLMQRRSTASETRLRNKFSLGIGGHVRQEDLAVGTSIFDWARREFAEEINYQGDLTIEPLGLLNDDTNEVGTVHLGLVMLIHGTTPDIKIKSELKSGILADKTTCQAHYEDLEQWSKLVFDYLLNQKTAPL